MKRVLVAAAMIASLAAPAVAQLRSGAGQPREQTPLDLMYEKERIEQQANERAYNEQMKRMKSQGPAAKTDPWAGVRPANESASSKR